MNAPHIVAQQQVPARKSKTVEMRLDPWKYQLRSLKLQTSSLIRTSADAKNSTATIRIHRPTLEPLALERINFQLGGFAPGGKDGRHETADPGDASQGGGDQIAQDALASGGLQGVQPLDNLSPGDWEVCLVLVHVRGY